MMKRRENLLRRLFLLFLMWNMRWMTRYLGVVARPFVRWVASREVIACGMRPGDEDAVTVIFTPAAGRSEHTVLKRRGRSWRPTPTRSLAPFSPDLILQEQLLEVSSGDSCRVQALRDVAGHPFIVRRSVASPRIVVKERTRQVPELLLVEPRGGGEVHFSWPEARSLEAMIYFLLLEDGSNRALFGIYTRERSWSYPHFERASLVVENPEARPLEGEATCTAKLLLVDFDGWVSHLAVKTFPPAPV